MMTAADTHARWGAQTGLVRAGLACFRWPFPNAPTAVVAVAGMAAELALLAWHPHGFWWNSGLGVPSKLGLAGLIALCWMMLAWLCEWHFRLVSLVSARTTMRWKTVVRWSAMAVFVVVANLYFCSWYFFWRMGTFPDTDVGYFGMFNFNMLAKYFWQTERLSSVAFVGAFMTVSVFLTLFARSMLRRIGSHDGPNQLRFSGVLVLTCFVNASWFAVDFAAVAHHQSLRPRDRVQAWNSRWPPYSFELRFHVNPLISAITCLTADFSRKLDGEIPSTALVPIAHAPSGDERATRPEDRRSIVLITIESLRSDVILKEYQGRQIMPHVNRLARNGHFFPNCYAQSSHSDYSDPCILSSLYPLRTEHHHYYRGTDPWPKILIYDLLKQHGYATAMFSSQNEAWGHMHLFYESPNLDVFFDSRSYDRPTRTHESSYKSWAAKVGLAGKLDDAVTAESAIRWMQEQQQAGSSFFVSLNFQTPHFPYRLPVQHAGPFKPAAEQANGSLFSFPRDEIEITRNTYFNALDYVDKQIGRLVEFLETHGLRKETIVIVTGDHGEAFYENGECGHARTPLETVLKTGLIVNCPGLLIPTKDPYLAQAIDIVPTALGLLGLRQHPAFQGEDILSPHRPPVEGRCLFIHCLNAAIAADAVISGTGWKYVFDHRAQQAELYYRPDDLTAHPNLLESNPKVAAKLHELYMNWRQRQLLYYDRPRYHTWFHAPRAPTPTPDVISLLQRAPERPKNPERGQ